MNVFRDDVLRESTSRRIKERDMSACLTSPGSRAPRGAGGGAWRACHADVIEAWVGGGRRGVPSHVKCLFCFPQNTSNETPKVT